MYRWTDEWVDEWMCKACVPKATDLVVAGVSGFFLEFRRKSSAHEQQGGIISIH